MKYRVLVVDDNTMNLMLVERILELEGYHVTAARSGQEALGLSGQKFDLAILDVMMPDMNGYELCVQLRRSEQNGDIPILLLTALSGDKERQLAEQAGANAVLAKPFDMEAFRTRVAEYLPVDRK